MRDLSGGNLTCHELSIFFYKGGIMSYLIFKKISRWLCGLLCLILIGSSVVYAGVTAGYSEYFIPGDEDNMMLVLDDIGANDHCHNRRVKKHHSLL